MLFNSRPASIPLFGTTSPRYQPRSMLNVFRICLSQDFFLKEFFFQTMRLEDPLKEYSRMKFLWSSFSVRSLRNYSERVMSTYVTILFFSCLAIFPWTRERLYYNFNPLHSYLKEVDQSSDKKYNYILRLKLPNFHEGITMIHHRIYYTNKRFEIIAVSMNPRKRKSVGEIVDTCR